MTYEDLYEAHRAEVLAALAAIDDRATITQAAADIAPRPDEQAAVVRLLSACGAGDLAECLGLTA